MPSPPPVCISVILCDLVVEDKRTNNKSFINTFNQIWTAEIPNHHAHMFIVVSLTECLRKHRLAIQITRDTPDGETDVIQMQGEISTPDPLAVVDLVFDVRGFPLLGLGKHTIRVKTLPDGQILCQRHFTVCQAKGQQTGPG